MRGLPSVLVEAERLLEEPGADLAPVLRELIDWAGLKPNPAERERIGAMGPAFDADKYLALPVVAMMNPQASGGIADTPQGPMAFFNLQVVVPLDNLKAGKILGPSGTVDNPADGMLPVFEARWVIPRARVAARVLRALGLEGRLNLTEILSREAPRSGDDGAGSKDQ